MKRLLFIIFSLLVWTGSLHAGWLDATLDFDGRVRNYRTYIPPGYDATKSASLIVVLHGLGGSMNDAANVGITSIADTANIILLSPQALDFNSPLGVIAAAWNSGVAVTIAGLGSIPVNADVDDVGFIKAIMDTTKMHYNVNSMRVYVCGASMGGFMTQRLACEAADRFAAVASVMGTYAKALPDCHPGKVLPVAHFHGTNDEVVSYNGDLLYSGNSFPVGLSVDALVANWAAQDNCLSMPQHETWPDANGDDLYAEHFIYSDAAARSRVELFKINGGTHFWYQYDNTGGEFDYSVEIWKFFNKQYANAMAVSDMHPPGVRIILYPNPAGDKLYMTSTEKIAEVILSDLFGKIVYTTYRVQDGSALDISHLPSGIYVARLQTKEHGSYIRKIVKQ